MFSKEDKASVVNLSFNELKEFKYDLELAGDEVAVLQNIMVDYAMNDKKLEDLVERTSRESVAGLFSKFHDLNVKNLTAAGVDVDKLKVKEQRL